MPGREDAATRRESPRKKPTSNPVSANTIAMSMRIPPSG
jgi:hypothetical protein